MTQPSAGGFYPDLWQALESRKCLRVYPKGTLLFQQGDEAAGVYLVESGRLHVWLPEGPASQVMEVALPGAVLGLCESVSGSQHRTAAEAVETTTVWFVKKQDFSDFLAQNREYCMQLVCLLSEDLHGLYQTFRSLPHGRKGEETAPN